MLHEASFTVGGVDYRTRPQDRAVSPRRPCAMPLRPPEGDPRHSKGTESQQTVTTARFAHAKMIGVEVLCILSGSASAEPSNRPGRTGTVLSRDKRGCGWTIRSSQRDEAHFRDARRWAFCFWRVAREPFSATAEDTVGIRRTRDKGEGSVYMRGPFWWISFSVNGARHTESTRSKKKKDATDLLQQRQSEILSGRFVSRAERVSFDDLVALIKADYEQKQHRTWERVEHAIKHLRPFFEKVPAVAITFDRVSRYITARLSQPRSSRGTVHKELAALGRMLTLAVHAGRLPTRPHLPTLKLDNVRKGFFTNEEVERVLSFLPEWYAPAIEFAWRTGWRIGEVKSLTWAQVDLNAGIVRLEPGTTKNRMGRTFPIYASPALMALLQRQREHTDAWQRQNNQIVPWVFWREGVKLGDHRDVWNRCCREAGVPGRLVHDLRRSAVRSMERAGLSRSVAMQLTGHLTESVYRRYAIVSEQDLADAVRKLSCATPQLHSRPSSTEARVDDSAKSL